MICYKLVNRVSTSNFGKTSHTTTGEYISINACLKLIYGIGTTTVPEIGRIYVFETYFDAWVAQCLYAADAVLRCECSRFRHIPALKAMFKYHEVIELFDRRKWGKTLKSSERVIGLTKKFATVSWLKPIEVI